ncbi:hypothetical protein BDN71DRAFT_726751 [Pleurotus eryngii]|uniref:Crinkler effector protein N-terminal domain-containing protein n=1 Tax=Pleurotus eryngii TaxID=5323 RepID=A0A9P5ZYH7_PLEER|nr:hypothetical protein BDN71DRAFT_726751 [Pleurotus eryngii]
MPGRVRMLGDADVLGLNCLITGDGLNNLFHVRVGKRCTVAELRAIVCRDAAVRTRFPDIGIEGIVLWKVYDVPQILLPPQGSRTNRSRFGETSEPLLLADIFRDSPVHDCLHVLVQRLRQFDAHSSPQETSDALRRPSPSGTPYPCPGWGDGVYSAPISRLSALALSSEPWSGPPALRSAPVGYLQQRSANTSPNSLAYSKAVGGQTSHMASVWGIDGAMDPSSTQVQHAGSFTRSSTFPSWGLSLSAPRSAASSPGRTASSIHQEHLEKAIFELVDEDAHDIHASDSQIQMHSPTPVDRIKPFNRGNQAFSSSPITNLHASLTSSPQSLPVLTYNNTPPISPLRSTPSYSSASPVSDTVTSSPFLSIWSLPSDITNHTSLIAYLRRLKSIARFHLTNMFRTRPAGQQVFWLEFASANEAVQVRDFLVVKKTSTGELVECPLVSEEEYLAASEMAGEADKWPNPHGLTNIPARPTASVIPRPPHVMNNAQGLPVMPQMQFQKQPPQRPTQDVSALATRTRSLDQPAHSIPTFHSPERTSVTYSAIPARSIPSPSPLPHRLETLPEDAEASESETDEADELSEAQASPTDLQSKTPPIGTKSLSSLEDNHTTPTRLQQLPRIGRVQRSVSVPTVLSARLT